ncbi:hypothetical protein [Phosphitispora fastidiosa]|uniref:hypothetical protein n=1 Tax=Phosphitispora fastidiosa TaxID=2837202 RepID=UPI001E29CDD9|nr:hypothetical protein [Phosphitispora fastidiosa]MBU7007088.1 hypothetical protein [Phosphitispora fastidiosa]
MKIMLSINADVQGTPKAEELKDKLVELFKQYGLDGSVRGDKYPSGVSYTAAYQKKQKKAAKPKYDPKYDPSQYFNATKKQEKNEV